MPRTINCVSKRKMAMKLMAFVLIPSIPGTDDLWSFWVLSIIEKMRCCWITWVLVSLLVETHDWQAHISHHRPRCWLEAGMKEALTSVHSEGRTPWEAEFALHDEELLTGASASFVLHITKSLDLILMLQKSLSSDLSLPPFALFALPIYYSSWQKIICGFISLYFHVGVPEIIKSIISSFGSGALFLYLFIFWMLSC